MFGDDSFSPQKSKSAWVSAMPPIIEPAMGLGPTIRAGRPWAALLSSQ